MHKNIVIDFGNSSIKLGLIENETIKDVIRFPNQSFDFDNFVEIINKISPSVICYLNVIRVEEKIIKYFNYLDAEIIHFTNSTPLPFDVLYKPRSTLGTDRLAGIVGATSLYTDSDILVIQIGTCITYDVYIHNKGYTGGAISPGIFLRSKSLNMFTSQLPLLDEKKIKKHKIIADSTYDALYSGIYNGILFEIHGFIEQTTQYNPDIKVILSGGDIAYFIKKIKNKIFAVSNITLTGLKEIIKLYKQHEYK